MKEGAKEERKGERERKEREMRLGDPERHQEGGPVKTEAKVSNVREEA